MNIKRLFLPLVVVVVVASAAFIFFPHPPVPPATPCNAGVCKVDVTVQSCENGALKADPDPIPVPGPNNIKWTLSTPGYKFASNGIVIDGKGFTDPQGTPNGKKFTVHDDHTDLRPAIKYAIRVVRESDNFSCKPFDPLISNQ